MMQLSLPNQGYRNSQKGKSVDPLSESLITSPSPIRVQSASEIVNHVGIELFPGDTRARHHSEKELGSASRQPCGSGTTARNCRWSLDGFEPVL